MALRRYLLAYLRLEDPEEYPRWERPHSVVVEADDDDMDGLLRDVNLSSGPRRGFVRPHQGPRASGPVTAARRMVGDDRLVQILAVTDLGHAPAY